MSAVARAVVTGFLFCLALPCQSAPSDMLAHFSKLVEAEREANYGRSYDLLPAAYKNNMSRKQYIDHRIQAEGGSKSMLKGLKVTGCEEFDKSIFGTRTWIISGCAQFLDSGRLVGWMVDTEVVSEKGEWKFSGISIRVKMDGPPDLCDFENTKGYLVE